MFDDISPWLILALVLVAAVTLFIVVRVLMRLFRLRRLATGPDAPTTAKVSFYGAWLYALSPIDLLPDPILIDDIGVVLAAIATIEAAARKHRSTRHQDGLVKLPAQRP